MNLQFCTPKHDNMDQFIKYWSSLYTYDKEVYYTNNIGKPLTEQSRKELFIWKNGRPLSNKKLQGIEKHYPLVYEGEATDYLNIFTKGGVIWNIFYAHIINQNWPIFDQHTYRAMIYIQTGKIANLVGSNKNKYEKYINNYVPFIRSLPYYNRNTDKALFVFGKFLNNAGRILNK